MMAKLQLNCGFNCANIDRIIDVSDSFMSDIITFVKQEIPNFFNKIDTFFETAEAK